jgi:hypothetical protein
MQNHRPKAADPEKQTGDVLEFKNSVPARVLITSAMFFAVVLLLSSIRGLPEHAHAYLSSLPLALAGVGYALLQIALRPARGKLMKRLLLAATFVGWAVDQMLPAGRLALFIGDTVIAAYVLDLYWIMQEQVGASDCRPGFDSTV